jgi:hypothetical protein
MFHEVNSICGGAYLAQSEGAPHDGRDDFFHDAAAPRLNASHWHKRSGGHVQVVERQNGTQNRDVPSWMLREGLRNNVVNEYPAVLCAKTGKLHEALTPPRTDRALLDGAADIFKALIYGRPANAIDDYPQASEALRDNGLDNAEPTARSTRDPVRWRRCVMDTSFGVQHTIQMPQWHILSR